MTAALSCCPVRYLLDGSDTVARYRRSIGIFLAVVPSIFWAKIGTAEPTPFLAAFQYQHRDISSDRLVTTPVSNGFYQGRHRDGVCCGRSFADPFGRYLLPNGFRPLGSAALVKFANDLAMPPVSNGNVASGLFLVQEVGVGWAKLDERQKFYYRRPSYDRPTGRQGQPNRQGERRSHKFHWHKRLRRRLPPRRQKLRIPC
jgi:hypothetical protein